MQITSDIAAKVLSVVDAGLVSGMGAPKPGEMCVEAAVCYALGLPHGDEPGCVVPALRSLKIRLNDSNWSSKKARAKGLRRLALAQLGSAGHLDEKEFCRRIADLALRKSCPAALRSAASVCKVCKANKHVAVLLDAAARCEKEGTRQAALDARTVARGAAADAAAAGYAAAAATNAAAAANAGYAAAAATNAGYAAAAATNAGYAAAAATNAAAADAAATDAAAAYAAAAARDAVLAAYAEDIVQILIEMKAPGCQWLSLTEVA